ncbi:RING/U-box superfamily protein, partial [Striga asiatica]
MGLGDADLLDDGDGGGCKASLAAAVSCSICLEVVADSRERSRAKLQCGHEFHLDCIGSAFNIKGAMQCPNCRKIEKGQWLYANGSRPLPEFSFEDWAHDEDLYDLSYSEMSFGLHWCPFARVPTSFGEGEFSSNHDLLGPHAVFAEHTPVSSTSHPCPYVTYFGPIHPSSSASSGSVSDGSSFNNHWNGPSGPSPTDVPSPYAFQSMDLHYQNWDQTSAYTTNTRIARNSSDIPRAGMHPFIVGHSAEIEDALWVSTNASYFPGYAQDLPGTVHHLSEASVNGLASARSTGRWCNASSNISWRLDLAGCQERRYSSISKTKRPTSSNEFWSML